MCAEREKLRALKVSTIAITSVVIVEVVLGFAVGSMAILSDGLHAALDALTMFILLITTKASFKPPDEEHMYGHEKFEPIGGLVGGIALIITGLIIMYEATLRFLKNVPINQELEYVGFIAIGYTLCIDLLRVGTFRKAFKSESTTLKAGLYHSMADLGSTIIAFFGFGLATMGFGGGDPLASIVLGFLLIYLSVKLVWKSGMELSDTASKDIVAEVRREVESTKGVSKVENLRVRKVGTKTFVETTVQVPEYLDFKESHDLATKIEDKLKQSFGNSEVMIHVEPLEKEMVTAKLLEKLAKTVEGVIDAHEVSIANANGKLYVTLHVRVDPAMSIQEAHDIAEKIEEKVRKEISIVDHVTVHVEPLDSKIRGSIIDEREIQKTAREAVEEFQQFLSLKRIVTYVIAGKRYINIDCCFTSHFSVGEAHKFASKVENSIKKKFTETVVTVHIEPKKEENAV